MYDVRECVDKTVTPDNDVTFGPRSSVNVMDNYGQGPIHQLIYWGGLNKSHIFNKDNKQAEKNEERLKAFERYPGRRVGFHQRFNLPLPIAGQETKFRLTPLLPIVEVNNKGRSDRRPSTIAAEKSILIGTDERSTEITDFLKQAALRHAQTVVPKKPDFVDDVPSPSPQHSPLPNKNSEASFWNSSDSSTPLPVFQRRQPTSCDQLLFRRPTIDKAVPLTTDDELFSLLSKTIDLKPIPFRKTADAYKFYETNFPLLLTKILADTDRCTTPSKRSRTPESPMSIMIARKRALNERLVDLECMMVDMARKTEDVKFKTELHDPVFDPTTWSWNQMDVAVLRRRYTIDASLREM